MAKAIETLSIKLQFTDAGTQQVLDKVKSSFKSLDRVITGSTKPAIQKLRNEINTFASAGNRSISNIDAQVTALRALRREADINSREFKELTADISKFEKQLGKAQGRRPGQGGRALAATQMAGAAISGGIFGGPEGFGGALIGGAFGGVPGAFAGAAIGAQVGMVRQSLGGVAETVAEINSMKIALAGVSKSAEDYNTSFANVVEISKEFLFPIDKAIGEFTKLKAAVVGAGFGTEETTDVFKGFAAAILATGGDAEKLSGALLAASQVFSKGKVQAEELRGQIGERLPGAFATFAGSIGVSTQELDKMLRDGKVSTKSFVDFSRTLFQQYSATAETLGSSPEKAGQRLQLALSFATLEYGGFFQKVGAGFQDYLTNLVNFATENKQNFIKIVADVVAFGQDITAQMSAAASNIVTPFVLGFQIIKDEIDGLISKFSLLAVAGKFVGQLIFRADGFDNPNVSLPPSGLPSREERATNIRNQLEALFAQFQPGKFGSSLGNLPLPGSAPNAPGGTGGGVKDLTQAEYNALAAKRATAQAPLFEREEAIRAEADAARAAAAALPPLKQKNELEEISKRENEQIAALHKEMNGVFKELGAGLAEQLKLDSELKASLQDRKYELGLITEEEYKQIEVERERAQLAAKGASPEQIEEQLSVFKKLLDETPIDKFIRDAGKELKDLQTMAVSVAQSIGNAIGNTLTSGVAGLIAGTKSAKEVLADFLKEFAGILAQQASKIIATYVAIGIAKIFAGFGSASTSAPKTMPDGVSQGGTFGGFNFGGVDQGLNFDVGANGGPVSGGSPMLVGERGPELFVPFTNGSITSSESLGADMANAMSVPFLPGGNRGGTTSQMLNRQENIQVNRQESLRQMSVPFTRTSEASMVASAEQQTAEAISNPAPLDVRFESQSINGVEYVTSEQHQSGMAQAAERGRALTLAALQNSVKARRRVGL